MTLAEKLLQDMNRGISYHFDEEKFLKTVADIFAKQNDRQYPYVDMMFKDYRSEAYNKEVSEYGFEVYYASTTAGPKPGICVHYPLLDTITETLRTNGFVVRDYCNARNKKCIKLF